MVRSADSLSENIASPLNYSYVLCLMSYVFSKKYISKVLICFQKSCELVKYRLLFTIRKNHMLASWVKLVMIFHCFQIIHKISRCKMNSQTKVFGQLLTESYEEAKDKQEITQEEIKEEWKSKLSVIVQKENWKWKVTLHRCLFFYDLASIEPIWISANRSNSFFFNSQIESLGSNVYNSWVGADCFCFRYVEWNKCNK